MSDEAKPGVPDDDMNDALGKPFKVGDTVWIPVTVGSKPRPDTGLVAVVSKHPRNPDDADGKAEYDTFYIHPRTVQVIGP